jgi:hypothetical protein
MEYRDILRGSRVDSVCVISTGSYLPARILSNEDGPEIC